MHAEFVISHEELGAEELKGFLRSKFRDENREAIKESALFSDGDWENAVLYATATPQYRLMCVSAQDEELQIYVEPTHGNVFDVCESIWKGVTRALRRSSPKLVSLKLNDNGNYFTAGRMTCFSLELKRRENLSPICIGIAVVVYTVVGLFTFAADQQFRFVAGAVTGVIGAVVALVLASTASKGGKLIWG
ncbi:hypothetical protein [Kribbella italica]|uniref:Uncharacterized protein n=1 Tax=Kribbella italica TaxID=1540520 RepID=A0A7W9JDR1_9ACTN|nr:hypothetical protein [Kribbella italica]MBB5840114.1 hypothetical protein [Kribbella italica]